MDWHAIQVLTGKEQQVISALKEYSASVMQPTAPSFLKSGGKSRLVQRPLMPGYVIANLNVTDFYKYKRELRVGKMMIRICGNGYGGAAASG